MLSTSNFTYELPPERIASYPLDVRDQSKLLVYDHGNIINGRFNELSSYLPANCVLYFNDTKVIAARLLFEKESGAVIEIFLLHPILPSALVLEAMQEQKRCVWKCKVGNLKRWKEPGLEKRSGDIIFTATLLDREEGQVEFVWTEGHTFATMISLFGETPLPPYIKRRAKESDRTQYQTIYSRHDGAVAAPTAGLHFTPGVFESLREKNIQTDFVTLHVSSGTFQPIKVEDVAKHVMHGEQVIIQRSNIEMLLRSDSIVPVGTTSLRTLESLYWFGVKLLEDPSAEFRIAQDYPYVEHKQLPSRKEALMAVMTHMEHHQTDYITGETSIFILPGYTFRMCEALITNFHQPGSTLILLVAAFIGDDWKLVYDEALRNDYRFLSYGDSSLLIPR